MKRGPKPNGGSHEREVIALSRGSFPLTPPVHLKLTRCERELWKKEAKKVRHLDATDTLQFAAYIRLASKVADEESLRARYLAQFNSLCRRLRIGTYQSVVDLKSKRAKLSEDMSGNIQISDAMVVLSR
jgi:hypothetical protein